LSSADHGGADGQWPDGEAWPAIVLSERAEGQ
jgi:hypothetical protein